MQRPKLLLIFLPEDTKVRCQEESRHHRDPSLEHTASRDGRKTELQPLGTLGGIKENMHMHEDAPKE